MINVYERYKANIVGVQEVPLKDTSKYGIVDGERAGKHIYRARDLVEKPNPAEAPVTRLAIMGRYILNSEIFGILENLQPGKGGEIQLTDGLRELNKLQEILAYVFEGHRYDLGDKLGFIKANIEYGLRRDDLSVELMKYLRKLVRQSKF